MDDDEGSIAVCPLGMKLGIRNGVVTDVAIVPFDQAKGAAFWRTN